MNLVESWFSQLTRKRLRRGVFRSVPELVAAIEAYLEHYNENPTPFVWTAIADATRTVVVEQYDGRQLNSPNDAVYASDGWLYFTDPPYGLEGLEESPLREHDFNGVYRLSPDGELELLVRDQTRPNGIALSPDERTLYVANSDSENKVWMAYDIDENGASNGLVFYDVNDQDAPGAADGMKVDLAGNIFATGPGGVWIFAPDGTHLGTISTGEVTANVGWGDDGRTLYMTASTSLYRIRLSTEGPIPGP